MYELASILTCCIQQLTPCIHLSHSWLWPREWKLTSQQVAWCWQNTTTSLKQLPLWQKCLLVGYSLLFMVTKMHTWITSCFKNVLTCDTLVVATILNAHYQMYFLNCFWRTEWREEEKKKALDLFQTQFDEQREWIPHCTPEVPTAKEKPGQPSD